MSATAGATTIVAGLLAALGLLAGLVGLGFYLARRERARTPSKPQRRLPKQWPLNPRPLANSAERRVWHWLRQVFPDHHVMVKLPITRFTMPREPGAATEWFEVLSSAYCTYTICDGQGVVIGCADLLGPRGLSRGNRQLKQTLLAQCGVGYWLLAPDALPSAEALRTEFLGAHILDSVLPRPTEQDRLEEVRLQLHEALDRSRNDRLRRAFPSAIGTDDETPSGDDHTPWPQPDSFLGSLDSRRTPLEKN